MDSSGLFDSIGKAAGKAAGDIATELTSFTKFQQRVDELIRDLKGSPAGEKRVGEERLSREQFGGGDGAWADAAGLFTSYQDVVKQLETLSRLLSDSMEGMKIAVLASHKGYQNIDVDIRDRMARIHAETTKHYEEHPGHRPYGDDPYTEFGTADGSNQAPGGGSSGAADGQPDTHGTSAHGTGEGGDAGGAI
jgi:hypothetical protein